MDPKSVYEVQQIIEKLKNLNMGILITDHNVRETLACVDHAYIMDAGNIISEGPSDVVVSDPLVLERYLGGTFVM